MHFNRFLTISQFPPPPLSLRQYFSHVIVASIAQLWVLGCALDTLDFIRSSSWSLHDMRWLIIATDFLSDEDLLKKPSYVA